MISKCLLHFPTKIGNLVIEMDQHKLVSLVISDAPAIKNQTSELDEDVDKKISVMVRLQLKNYFSSATPFQTIPLAANGTEFQKSVWRELCKIPFGETRTYGEIAKKLNSSARAVGNACRKNPIQIIVPCHRVISAKGLGGYAGETEGKQLNIKRWLLAHEGLMV